MNPVRIPRPAATEYSPDYADYVRRIADGDVLEMLAQQAESTASLLAPLSDAEAGFRYQPEKWSIRQVVGHLGDTERVLTYRALCFSRGERIGLPGFDEQAYVAGARFDARTMSSLLAELRIVRTATIALFSGLDAEQLARRGMANGANVSVRALAYIVAGHERHHQAILSERYLGMLRRSSAGAR